MVNPQITFFERYVFLLDQAIFIPKKIQILRSLQTITKNSHNPIASVSFPNGNRYEPLLKDIYANSKFEKEIIRERTCFLVDVVEGYDNEKPDLIVQKLNEHFSRLNGLIEDTEM